MIGDVTAAEGVHHRGRNQRVVDRKALKDNSMPFDCFEMSDQVGGNWVFRNKNCRSAAYHRYISILRRSGCSSTIFRSH